MAVEIRGSNSNLANVTVENELSTALTLNADKAGFAIMAAESHNGEVGAPRLVREAEVSPDYRLRTGVDTLLWSDTFNHAQFNTSKYQGVTSTATLTIAGGRMVFNGGNSVASGAVARATTYRPFPLYLSYALYVDFELAFIQDPVQNNVGEFGLFYAATTAAPTDGVYFRLNGSGQLVGVINNNNAETIVVLDYVPQASMMNHYLIVIHNDETEFWINDVLYGTIVTPTSVGSPTLSMSLPLNMRCYNSAATSLAQRMEVANVSVSIGDMNAIRLWSTTMSGMGQSSINIPDSVAGGYTANSANSAAPASATLSNTAAGYTTLGGQFQFVAVAGAETDYALFAYQVPVGSAAVPAKNLIVRGVRIDAYAMGAAIATTPTLLQWSMGVGSTAVTLATSDSATAGTRAPRRLTLGVQSLPVASPIGYAANPVDINLDAPLLVEAGTFLHIILKMPVGTATASSIIRGVVSINGFFE